MPVYNTVPNAKTDHVHVTTPKQLQLTQHDAHIAYSNDDETSTTSLYTSSQVSPVTRSFNIPISRSTDVFVCDQINQVTTTEELNYSPFISALNYTPAEDMPKGHNKRRLSSGNRSESPKVSPPTTVNVYKSTQSPNVSKKEIPIVYLQRIPNDQLLKATKSDMIDKPSSGRRVKPHSLPPQKEQQQSISEPNGTVLLVNSDVEETLIILPERKEQMLQTERLTTTLDVLRTGILSYMRARRFNDGKTAFNNDWLEIFCCKLPQKKKYHFYKRVQAIELRSDGNQSTQEENADTLYGTFNLINRYIKCFATLAEFSFEFSLPNPLMNSGISNVLIADKVWNYNTEKRVYVPSYKLLTGDVYTDYILFSLKRLYHCENIEFISTLHTALFANYDVLVEPTTQSSHPKILPAIETVMSSRPLKKRKLVTPDCSRVVETTHATQQREENQLCTKEQRKSPRKPSDPGDSFFCGKSLSNVPTNPTLIVLKQPFVKGNQCLVCPISIEIHLTSQVAYS